MALNHELTEILRLRIFEAVDNFAREFDLDPVKLELDANFILAHMTGKIGDLTKGWQERINERRRRDEDHKAKAEASPEGPPGGRRTGTI